MSTIYKSHHLLLNHYPRANTLSWSPDSTQLAYNAWMDNDGDGFISTFPPMDQESLTIDLVYDRSQIFVYDVRDNSTVQLTSDTIDYAPTFVSNERLAFGALDFVDVMAGGSPTSIIYDLITMSATPIPVMQDFVVGMDVSPNGTQIAWLDLPWSEQNPPATLHIAGTDFTNPQTIVLPSQAPQLPDTPIWLDNNIVLITYTNTLSAFVSSLNGSPTATSQTQSDSENPVQQIITVNISDGAINVIYEAGMYNSSYSVSLITFSSAMSSIMNLDE